MRITLKYLKESLQKEFDRLEVKATVNEAHKTRCTSNQYEAGAAVYIFNCSNESGGIFQVYMFYFIYQLQIELNNGYELYWRPRNHVYLNESELSIRKK